MHKVAIKAYILNKQGELLVVKRSDTDSILPGYWELPGGGLEDREKPTEALRREVKEETGLDVVVQYPVHAASLLLENTQQKQALDIFFLCTNKTANQHVSISPEHSGYRWVNKNNVHVTPMTDWMRTILTVIAQHPLVKRTI